jgi:type IV pilus assembly protein PilF
MKKGVWLVLIALAGCSNTGGSQSPSMPGPVVESESRDKAKVFTELGFEYYKREQMKVALEQARKAIAAENRYGPAYHLLGLIYMDVGEDKLAEENFQKAIELEPAYSEAKVSYGSFLCARGRYDEGQAQFTDAMRNPLYDKPEQALANAGLCSEKKGDLKQAEAYYNKALKLQPNAPQPTIRLALLQFTNGNLNEARRLLTRFLEISQPSAEALWLGLRIERKLGDKNQEAYYNQQLRRRFPDAQETQLMLRGQYE